MKKSLLFMLAAGTLAACGTQNKAIVDGTVTGLDDGTAVYLMVGSEISDSTRVEGGRFRLEVANAYPDRAHLQFGKKPSLQFFIEPGTIDVAVDFESSPAKAVFSGTDTNDRMNAMNDGMAVFNDTMRELTPRLIALDSEGKSGTPEYDSLIAIYKDAYKGSNEYNNNTILGAPDAIFTAYLLNSGSHAQTTPELMDSVINMVAGAPANAFTDRMKERRELLAQTAVGQPAPDFTQEMADGTPFSLSSLKGRLVLIDFWASWCGPCRSENPNVVKVYNKYHDRGFEIVGVSLDNNRDNWLKAIEDDGLTWIHVSDLKDWSNAVAGQYAVRSIPHTVLVGPDGMILAKNLRGAALEAKIAEVLDVTE